MNPITTSKRMLNPTRTPGVTTSTIPASEGHSTNEDRTTHRTVNPTSTPDVTTFTVPASEGSSTNAHSTTHRTVNPTSTTHKTVNPTSTLDVTAPTTATAVRDRTNPASTTHISPTSTHDVTDSTAPAFFTKSVLDLNVTAVNHQITRPGFVAALTAGEAAVVNDDSLVVKINYSGHTVEELYNCHSCNNIHGLLLLGSNLNVVHGNGTIIEILPHTGTLLNIYNIHNVSHIRHHGSLWSDPSKIPNTDILLLPDHNKGEVFSYNLTSRHKQVHLTGLSNPSSVSYSFYNNSTHYIVCQFGRHTISIYNSSWHLVSSFGGYDSSGGYLDSPSAAIISTNNSILVSQFYNDRISVFTTDGVFLYHLLTQSDGIYHPFSLSYYKPYLWVVDAYYNKFYRYRLFK